MRRKLISIFLVCIFLLSACGKEEVKTTTQEIKKPEEKVPYISKELSLPETLMTENSQGSDYIGDEFGGFVSDIQGKPAIYYGDFTLEAEEYLATLIRWSLDADQNWVVDELCENALSDFMNQKYEQVSWVRCSLNHFRRGDNGSLYAVFSYYVKEDVVKEEETTEQIVQKYSILEIDEESDSLYEIPLEIGPRPQEEVSFRGEVEVEWISDYHVFEDGTILLMSSDNGGGYGYLIDGESGQVSEELGNVVTGKRRFVFGEEEIVFFSNNTNTFQVLGIPALEQTNTLGSQLEENVLKKDWYLYMNPDTWELFLCNESGVYKAVNYQNSDEVEWLTEKTDMSEIESGDSNILDFFVGAEEDFYVCMMETTEEYGMEYKQYRIVYYSKEK